MSGKACAPQNARARALVATMTGCRVTSDWSRGTRAELRERRFEGRTSVLTTSLAPVFATVRATSLARRSKSWSSWTLSRSLPPLGGASGRTVELKRGWKERRTGSWKKNPHQGARPTHRYFQLNTQGWPSLCPPAQRYAREPRPFMDKPADARRKPRSSARRKVRQGRFLKTRTGLVSYQGRCRRGQHRPRPASYHVDGSRDRIFLLARRVHDLLEKISQDRKSRPIRKRDLTKSHTKEKRPHKIERAR